MALTAVPGSERRSWGTATLGAVEKLHDSRPFQTSLSLVHSVDRGCEKLFESARALVDYRTYKGILEGLGVVAAKGYLVATHQSHPAKEFPNSYAWIHQPRHQYEKLLTAAERSWINPAFWFDQPLQAFDTFSVDLGSTLLTAGFTAYGVAPAAARSMTLSEFAANSTGLVKNAGRQLHNAAERIGNQILPPPAAIAVMPNGRTLSVTLPKNASTTAPAWLGGGRLTGPNVNAPMLMAAGGSRRGAISHGDRLRRAKARHRDALALNNPEAVVREAIIRGQLPRTLAVLEGLREDLLRLLVMRNHQTLRRSIGERFFPRDARIVTTIRLFIEEIDLRLVAMDPNRMAQVSFHEAETLHQAALRRHQWLLRERPDVGGRSGSRVIPGQVFTATPGASVAEVYRELAEAFRQRIRTIRMLEPP